MIVQTRSMPLPYPHWILTSPNEMRSKESNRRRTSLDRQR
jgi:hypothetical protein